MVAPREILQAGRGGADKRGMRTILAALACLAGLIAGAWLGRIEGAEPLVVALTSSAIAAALMAWLGLFVVPDASADRWAGGLIVALVLAGGLLRGASVGVVERERSLVRGEREWALAGPSELREFEVEGASEPGARCTLRVRDPERPDADSFELALAAEACPRARGDRIAVVARELEPASRRLPSRREGWSLSGERSPWSRPRPAPSSLDLYWRWVAQLRQRAWAATRGDRAASLSAAVGLGLRASLDPDDREALRGAGLGHLIAVSGLHVAVAGLWLQVLARRLAVILACSARSTCALAWLPLLAYVGLTGGAAPAVRAAAMLIALDIGTLLGRPTHGPTLLALVAAAMAAIAPTWVFDPGFQLSVVAMAAIVTAPADQGVLRSSWRITWATAPLCVIHFDVAPMHALLGNLVALPLFSLLMPASLLGWALHGWLGDPILAPARLLAEPILDLSALLARVPGADAGTLAGLAGSLLLVDLAWRAWARRAGRAPSESGLARWMPPRLALVASLAVALPITSHDSRSLLLRAPFDWVAVGSASSRSLLIRDRTSPRFAPRACLIRPLLGPGDTEALLDQLGVRSLVTIVESPERAATRDPRSEALARELEQRGIEVGELGEFGELGLDHCPSPAKPALRDALRACQARHGGRGRVVVRAGPTGTRCWLDDRWIALPELDPEADIIDP